jgi:hypothetical protein
MRVKKETEAQRKIREARELVKAAKQAEQEAWREKWAKQQQDPEYQRKQAQRNANSEARSRKRDVNKENNKLEYTAETVKRHETNYRLFQKHPYGYFCECSCDACYEGDHDYCNDEDCVYIDEPKPWKDEEYNTAVHESGHAILQELVAGGCNHVTIVPQELTKGYGDDKKAYSVLGYSQGRGGNGDIEVDAIVNVAGGVATQIVLGSDDISDGDREHLEANMREAGLMAQFSTEASQKFERDVRAKTKAILSEPPIKAALLETADALVVDKTLSGWDVKAIINKHRYPNLFQFDAGKQYKFHFRKNRVSGYFGSAPFSLGIGDYHSGYTLSQPQYVRDIEQAEKDGKSAKLVPFPVKPAIQMLFQFPEAVQKKSIRQSKPWLTMVDTRVEVSGFVRPRRLG